jgi:hypothetical protein
MTASRRIIKGVFGVPFLAWRLFYLFGASGAATNQDH